jgi:N-sulfoglucosamine sulfohydrolase
MRTPAFLSALAVILPLLGPSPVRAAGRPHIILFVSDDHGWADSGAYGNKVVRTPHLDALARQGMHFTHAFAASPTCSPSRSALLTGLMPFRNGAHANHSDVRPDVRSWPHYFKALGYRVVLAGKADVRPRKAFPFEYPRSQKREPGKPRGLYMNLDTDAVARILAEHDRSTPLCLVVCSHSPHVYWPKNKGYDPAKVDLPPYLVDTPVTRRARTEYYTDITLMDERLGAVLRAAKEHGYKDALFAYTTDQGAQWPHAKWNLYDAGLRTPLIVRWPGHVEAGSTSDAMVSLVDLLPTFLEAAGGKPPADIDGRSFLDVLRGKKEGHREVIFAAHTGDGRMNRTPMRCVRTRTHKYILNLRPDLEYTTHITDGIDLDGRDYWKSWLQKARTDPAAAAIVRAYQNRPAEELYDLRKDPHEMKNVAGDPANAELLASLRKQLAAWRKEQGDAVTGKEGK